MNSISADIIVIGSGFGGAVAADRLVRAGLKVTLLERGPWRRTAPVLAKGLKHAAPLPVQDRPGLILRTIRSNKGPKEICLNRRGLLELHIGNGVKTLASSGVGGGSHLWAALLAHPENREYWNGRADGLSESLIASHYTQVAEELGAVRPMQVESLPNHTSHAWQGRGWFETVSEDEQYPFAFLFPQQNGGCASAGRELSQLNGKDGLFGSPKASKANVETTYLLPHLDAGLKVYDMAEVLTIGSIDSGGYEVIAKNHAKGEISRYRAPRVILAAGTLNTIKILCASQEAGTLRTMPRLGKGFGTNGDCLGSWRPTIDPCNSSLGSPIHGRLKIRDHPQGVNLIIGGLDAIPLPRWLPARVKAWVATRAQRQFQLITMGEDRANGTALFNRNRLQLDYDLNDSDIYRKIFNLLDSISALSGTPVNFERKTVVTAHPMGGCRIGSSSDEGVIDGEGQVYRNPGLYIADASVLPAPTGGPPSLTIAAWSSHMASALIKGL